MHQVPDTVALNLNRQGLGVETAAFTLGAEKVLFPAMVLNHAKPIAAGTGPLVAVKGKEPGIQFLKSDATGRTNTPAAEYLLMPLCIDDDKTAVSFLEGKGYSLMEILCRQLSNHELNGVLMVAAQGHARFKWCEASVDSGLFKSYLDGPVEHVLMEPLAAVYFGCQDSCLPAIEGLFNLGEDFGRGLGREPAGASRAVLGAELAVEESQKVVDLGQGRHGGSSAGVADALLYGHCRRNS